MMTHDETTRRIIERITVRYDEPVALPTGQRSRIFYDCFQLTPNELSRLAALAIGSLDPDLFDTAVGLAYGGIFFAAAVAGGRTVGILQKDGRYRGPTLEGRRVVLVDDVIHSGSSVAKARAAVETSGATVVGLACIVDRSGGAMNTEALPLWAAFEA